MRAFRKLETACARSFARLLVISLALSAMVPAHAAPTVGSVADRSAVSDGAPKQASADPLRGPLLDLRHPPRPMAILAGGRTVAMGACSPASAVRVVAANGRKSGAVALAAASVVTDVDVADTIFHSGFEIFGSSCSVNANCPPTGDECIGNVCTSDVCSAAAATTGTACASGICDGAGSCVQCLNNSNCPAAPTECTESICASGTCVQPAKTAGTSCNSGTGFCDGFGNCVQCLGANDCPNTGSECLLKQCVADICLPTPAPIGMGCSSFGGGHCDGTGSCVQCLVVADCPATGTECKQPVCTAGMCGIVNAAGGTACTGGTCDGAGNCVP